MSPFPPWQDLPQELLTIIAKFLLQNPLHLSRFRSVCQSWRSSSNSLFPAKPIINFPFKLPSPYILNSQSFLPYNNYSISVTTVYTLIHNSSSSSPKVWAFFAEQFNPAKLRVLKPFSKQPFFMPLDFPRSINFLDYNASEIGRFYTVVWRYDGGEVVRMFSCDGFDKVVVLSNGFGVVLIYDDGKLGFLKLGVEGSVGSGNGWGVIHDGRGFRFDDIVEFNDRVLGIDRRGRVYEMSYELLEMNVVVPCIGGGGGGRRKRLIESLGKLYLVARCKDDGIKDETKKFKVYVLNEEMKKWVEVDSVGDRVFFFGEEFSISASIHEFEGSIGRNCIIYDQYSFKKYVRKGGEDALFGTPRYGLHVVVYHMEETSRLCWIESYPGYNAVFWPPPTWLWPNDKLKLLGTFEATISTLLKVTSDMNLKVKYKELSPFVGALVSGEDISQLGIISVLKEDMLNQFLDKLVEVIDKESTTIKLNITQDALLRKQHRKFINRPNQEDLMQEGTICLRAKDGFADTPEDATQHSISIEEWVSSEVFRRLGTHVELKVLLGGIIRVIGKHKDKILDSSTFLTNKLC